MAKRYALKGINDDEQVCAVCGKIELQRVMWLAELSDEGDEIGEPFHCGTTCGAKLLGRSVSKVRTATKNFEGAVLLKRQRLSEQHESAQRQRECIDLLNAKGLLGKARFEHPLMKELLALQAEARAWANAQDISIEI